MFGTSIGDTIESIKNLIINDKDIMTERQRIENEIKEFNNSEARKWMITGERYYKVDNDIMYREFYKALPDGSLVKDTAKANNKLAHGFIKLLIDEKVAYLLALPYSLNTEDNNKASIERVKEVLGKRFGYTLAGFGYEASKKGIAWGQVYIDEAGKFKIMMIPTEQCIPIWKDNSHTELEGMIRYFVQVQYEGQNKKEITKVEYWTAEGMQYFEEVDGKLIPDIERMMALGYGQDFGDTLPHYKKGTEYKNWGRVPFVCFKNNRIEYPDIRFIKSLIDGYDNSRSDISNFLDEVKNLIYVLRNYGGQDLAEFMADLNYYRAIKVDDDGGVETVTPQLDITATKEHFEQLKADITEFGQGTRKDLDKIGSSPSGIALKFLYSGLDLKANALDVEFQQGFKDLLYFVGVFLGETSKGAIDPESIDIIFNRDITINETEAIENCSKSSGIISQQTIIANHPWVTDVEDEIKRLEEDKKAAADLQKQTFGFNVDNGGATGDGTTEPDNTNTDEGDE